MMFSSTIIGKLLPSSMMMHHRVGELMISVLLMQDLIAIGVMIALKCYTTDAFGISQASMILLSVPGLLVFTYVIEKYILVRLFSRFERIREYLFLLAIAWCLSMSEAPYLGLSYEVGAFIAGVSVASSPGAYLAECLKPIRDFS